MKCPRRAENPGPWKFLPEEDSWDRDNTCSYCGSINPDEFMRLAEAGTELGPTDKSYKVYMPTGKFYFQHLSEEQCRKFVDLLNEKKLVIGYPGHFYSKPFFVQYK